MLLHRSLVYTHMLLTGLLENHTKRYEHQGKQQVYSNTIRRKIGDETVITPVRTDIYADTMETQDRFDLIVLLCMLTM